MMTNNVKLSVLSTVPLTKMDHKQVGLVVVALLGMNMNHFLAKKEHCDGVCNRRSLGVTTSIAADDTSEARLTPALHRPSLLS